MTADHRMTALVPVPMRAPDSMAGPVSQVLAGEYEAGYSGSGLRILDIGANVGAFSVWATMRWPDSDVFAYEPHPGTFSMLEFNTRPLPRVHAVNAAVYPSDEAQLQLVQRYDGDGESTLSQYASYFDSEVGCAVDVEVVHPHALPRADVVKIDVEGAEVEILRHLDLTAAGLVLLEYQDDANRDAVLELMADDFLLEYRDDHPWDALLGNRDYARGMAGQSYGHLFFVSRRPHRLQHTGVPGPLSGQQRRWRDLTGPVRRLTRTGLRRFRAERP